VQVFRKALWELVSSLVLATFPSRSVQVDEITLLRCHRSSCRNNFTRLGTLRVDGVGIMVETYELPSRAQMLNEYFQTDIS